MKEQQESVALLRNNTQNSDDYNENNVNGRFSLVLRVFIPLTIPRLLHE